MQPRDAELLGVDGDRGAERAVVVNEGGGGEWEWCEGLFRDAGGGGVVEGPRHAVALVESAVLVEDVEQFVWVLGEEEYSGGGRVVEVKVDEVESVVG